MRGRGCVPAAAERAKFGVTEGVDGFVKYNRGGGEPPADVHSLHKLICAASAAGVNDNHLINEIKVM